MYTSADEAEAIVTAEFYECVRLFQLKDVHLNPRLCKALLRKIIYWYSKKNREYHTLVHSADGIYYFRELRPYFSEYEIAILAWLFHDYYYVPFSPHNEARSAERAEKLLRYMEMPDLVILKVSEIIRSTKTHIVPTNCSGAWIECAYVHDIDLASLGAHPTMFRDDGKLLQKEFGLSDREWLESAASFARGFLTRESIYQTIWFINHFEKQAQANLRWALVGFPENEIPVNV